MGEHERHGCLVPHSVAAAAGRIGVGALAMASRYARRVAREARHAGWSIDGRRGRLLADAPDLSEGVRRLRAAEDTPAFAVVDRVLMGATDQVGLSRLRGRECLRRRRAAEADACPYCPDAAA